MTDQPADNEPQDQQDQQQTPGIGALKEGARRRAQNLEGKFLRPTPKKQVKVGRQTVTLPRTPPGWYEGIRRSMQMNDPPEHMANWDKLTPSEKQFMDMLPGVAATGVGRTLAKLQDAPIVGGTLDYAAAFARNAEKTLGYTYQAFFDDDLKPFDFDSWRFLTKQNVRDLAPFPRFRQSGPRGLIEAPEPRRVDYSKLSDKERKMQAAWDAAPLFYEVMASPDAPVWGDLHEGVFPWIGAMYTDPKGFFKALWKDLPRAYDNIVHGVNYEPNPETLRFFKKWGLEDFFLAERSKDTPIPSLVAERERIRENQNWLERQVPTFQPTTERGVRGKQWLEDFFSGSTIKELGGLPALVKVRQAIINGEDPQTAIDAYRKEMGALAFRGQLYDLSAQMAFDPLNLAFLVPNPVEGVHAIRSVALTARVSPQVLDKMNDVRRAADAIGDVTKTIDYTTDITRGSRFIMGEADDLSDLAHLENAIGDFRKAADELGNGQFTQVADNLEAILVEAQEGGRIDLAELETLAMQISEETTAPYKKGTFINFIKKDADPESLAAFADDVTRRTLESVQQEGESLADTIRRIKEGSTNSFQVQNVASKVDEALGEAAELFARMEELRPMSRVERWVIAATGGDPFHPAGRFARLNPFALSPAARANEFINVMYNNLSTLLRSAGDDVAEMSRLVKSAAAGAFGGRFGHAFVSPVGQYIQGVLEATAGHTDDLLEAWMTTAPQRHLANRIAQASGIDTVELIGRLVRGGEDEAEGIIRILGDVAQGSDNPNLIQLGELIDTGRLAPKNLIELGELFKATPENIVPYTEDLFRASIIRAMAESSAEYAKLRFGVKEARMIEKGMLYVKAAESLALLGLNPFYPVQNFFNNEFTMLSRGVFSTMVPSVLTEKVPALRKVVASVDDVLETFKINPAGFSEGFGIVGPEIIEDIARGAEAGELAGLTAAKRGLRNFIWGTPKGVGGWILEKARNSKDLRKVAAMGERFASERAFATGFLKSWNKLWRAGRGYRHMDDIVPGLSDTLKALDAEYAAYLDDAIRSARNSDDLAAVLSKTDNLRLQHESLMRRTAEALGVENDRLLNGLTEELNESVRRVIDDLPANPSKGQIDDAITDIETVVESSLDEMIDSQIPIMVEEHAARAEASGPKGILQTYGEISDYVTSRRVDHARMLDEGVARINDIEDPFLRNKAWVALKQTADRAWNRTWNIEEAARRGIVRGLKARGVDAPEDFLDSFLTLRGQTQRYIGTRNDLWDTHFKKLLEGGFESELDRAEDIARIYEQLDDQYLKLIDTTVHAHKRMDQLFIDLFAEGADERLIGATREWRNILVDMRRADMENLLNFRRRIRGLSTESKAPLWREFWQTRIKDDLRMSKMEEYGRLMLTGDDEALDFFYRNSQAKLESLVDDIPGITEQARQIGLDLDENQIRMLHALDTSQQAFDVRIVKEFDEEGAEFALARVRWGERTPNGQIPMELTSRLFQQTPDYMRDVLVEEVAHFLGEARQDGELLYADEIAEVFTKGPHDPIENMTDAVKQFYNDPAALRESNPDAFRWVNSVMQDETELRAVLDEIHGALPSAAAPHVGDGRPVPTVPDFDRVVGKQIYMGTGVDELWFGQSKRIIDELRRQAYRAVDEPPLRISSLPENVQDDIRRYTNVIQGDLNDSRLASIRMAKGMRDAALLNYSRRYNIDNWASVVFPFHFWYTHSMARWALHSLDRPQIIAAYAKMRQFMDEVIGEHEGFPSRLRGQIKVDLPFVPESMGDVWVDPFRSFGLPFEQFTYPFEQWQRSTITVENRTERRLEEMLSAGEIGREEYQTALSTKQGPVWERARGLVLRDDANANFDLVDFMNLSTSPHIPISALIHTFRGQPEKALPPLPATRSIKNIATLLGVDPGVYDSTWGNVRRHFGLPAFDEWDSYKVDREISNMIAEQALVDGRPVTVEEGLKAQITSEGPIFEEARRRVAQSDAIRWSSKFLGIPINSYPEGEEHLRGLYNEFYTALDLRDRGDPTVLRDFFDDHPEFESRLALWKEPEERMQSFLIDNIWQQWNEMPDLHQDEMYEHLGPLFQDAFINKDTRSYDAIPVEVLQTWLKIMGGDPPGRVTYSSDLTPIELTDPRIAQRMQVFEETREQLFRYRDSIIPLQQDYYRLEEGAARRRFREENPNLVAYWNWRRDFMIRNPSLAPYIEDNAEDRPRYPSAEALQQAEAAEPNFTWQEWSAVLGPDTSELLIDFYVDDEEIPDAVKEKLEQVADEMGLPDYLDWRDMIDIIGEQASEAQIQGMLY